MHLKKLVLFLDTQCMYSLTVVISYLTYELDRMPPQIGRIISKSVYDDQLKSNPQHPIHDKVTACYFLDVATGKEEALAGGSFKVSTL